MTRGPDPDRPQNARPVCTESFDATIRDGVGAAVGLLSTVFGAVALEADNETFGVPLLVGGLAVMIGAYVSGGIGYFRIKKCRRAVEEWERQNAPAAAPAAVTPTGP